MKTKRRKTLEETALRYGLNDNILAAIDGYINRDAPFTGETRNLISFLLVGRSDAERRWLSEGDEMLCAHIGQPVVLRLYEWFSFKLPGGSYTPDYSYLMADGRWVHVEIKASRFQAGYRDARSKLRSAANLNPWFSFVEARLEKGVWHLETVKFDRDYLCNLIGIVNDP